MNSPFLLFVGLLACVVRFFIADIADEKLLIIMAMINIVAFDYVILILFQDAKKIVIDKMNKSQITEKMKKDNNKKLNIFYFAFYIFIFVVVGFVYVFFLRSSALNDSISIMALVISISSDKLSSMLGNVFYYFL